MRTIASRARRRRCRSSQVMRCVSSSRITSAVSRRWRTISERPRVRLRNWSRGRPIRCLPGRLRDRDRDARPRHGAHDPELTPRRAARRRVHGDRRLERAGDLDAGDRGRNRRAARRVRAGLRGRQAPGRRLPRLARRPLARGCDSRSFAGSLRARDAAARSRAASRSGRACSATSGTRRWPPSSRACCRSSRRSSTRSPRCSASASSSRS